VSHDDIRSHAPAKAAGDVACKHAQGQLYGRRGKHIVKLTTHDSVRNSRLDGASSLWSGRSAAQRYRVSSSSASVARPPRFFSPGLSSSSTVPIAANPAATAASFAAFFAVALTFDGVIEGERFLLFATRFALVLRLKMP
jgi:hypothetical protein